MHHCKGGGARKILYAMILTPNVKVRGAPLTDIQRSRRTPKLPPTVITASGRRVPLTAELDQEITPKTARPQEENPLTLEKGSHLLFMRF